MLATYESKIKTNLKKAQGQLELINKMIEEKRYCVDIAQQVNAAIGLLKQVNNYILEGHLLSCGASKLNSKNEATKLAFAQELVRTFDLTKK